MKRLDRRTVLRGASGLALGLPFLEAMRPRGTAQAADAVAPKRVVVWYNGIGTVLGKWLPTGTGTNYTTSEILAPLDTPSLRPRLAIVSGIQSGAGKKLAGNGHSVGMTTLLTGRPFTDIKQTQFGDVGWGGGISIDQLLAQRLALPGQLASIEAGILTRSGGASAYMSYSGPGQAGIVAAEPDPRKVFARIFANAPRGASTAAVEQAARLRRSVLDTVQRDFARISGKLGAEDQARLDKHLALIRDLEERVQVGASCQVPTAPAFADDDIKANARIPEIGRAQMDLVATALACDATRVATLQWAGGESRFDFKDVIPSAPWDKLTCPSGVDSCSDGDANSAHHVMSHILPSTAGGVPENMSEAQSTALLCLTAVYKWYSEQLAYFAQRLADTPDVDGRSVLDNTIIISVTEVAEGPSHSFDDMAFLLLGGTGVIRPGHFALRNEQTTNNLFLTVAQAAGLSDITEFGDPEFSSGSISALRV